jgi:DNA-binding response OmpR family regulator
VETLRRLAEVQELADGEEVTKVPKLDRRVLRELVTRLCACASVVGSLRPHASLPGSVPDDANAARSERINYLLAAGMRPICQTKRSKTICVSIPGPQRLKQGADVWPCTQIVGPDDRISGMARQRSSPMLFGRSIRKAGSAEHMTGSTILVVDDELDVRSLVRKILELRGYEVREAATGRDALKALFEQRPDAVVLDVSMPGLDGWGTLERIRELTDVPVLMLTAQTQEIDKVRGLNAGADGYMTKPFGRQELLARVEALLRRTPRTVDGVPAAYVDSELTVDFAQRSVQSRGGEVRLTPLEFRLLSAFVRHVNQVLSREQLLELAWDDPYEVSEDQVKLYVGYLRRKLQEHGGPDASIETVRGFGYRYRPAGRC